MTVTRFPPNTDFGGHGSRAALVTWTESGPRTDDGKPARGLLRVRRPKVGDRYLVVSGADYGSGGQPKVVEALGGSYFLVSSPGGTGWMSRGQSGYYAASLLLVQQREGQWYQIAEAEDMGQGGRSAARRALIAVMGAG